MSKARSSHTRNTELKVYKDPYADEDSYTPEWVESMIITYIEYYLLPTKEKVKFKDNKVGVFSTLPSKAGCALFLNMTRRELKKWRDDYPDTIGLALEKLDDLSDLMITEGGLTNKLNPTFAIWIQKSRSGAIEESKKQYLDIYRDKKAALSSVHEERELLADLDDEEIEMRSRELMDQIKEAREREVVEDGDTKELS